MQPKAQPDLVEAVQENCGLQDVSRRDVVQAARKLGDVFKEHFPEWNPAQTLRYYREIIHDVPHPPPYKLLFDDETEARRYADAAEEWYDIKLVVKRVRDKRFKLELI